MTLRVARERRQASFQASGVRKKKGPGQKRTPYWLRLLRPLKPRQSMWHFGWIEETPHPLLPCPHLRPRSPQPQRRYLSSGGRQGGEGLGKRSQLRASGARGLRTQPQSQKSLQPLPTPPLRSEALRTPSQGHRAAVHPQGMVARSHHGLLPVIHT